MITKPLFKLQLARQSLKDGSLMAIFNLTKFDWIFNWTMIEVREILFTTKYFYCQIFSLFRFFIFLSFLINIKCCSVCIFSFSFVSISKHFRYATEEKSFESWKYFFSFAVSHMVLQLWWKSHAGRHIRRRDVTHGGYAICWGK